MATNNRPTMDTGYIPPKPKSKPLQLKRGKARAWRASNPILLNGEPGYEWDTHKMKVGDGRTPWHLLPYIGDHVKDGKSAYQLWLEMGNTGTVEDFLESLIGEPGKSAYEIWLSCGNEGTVLDFINAIHGEKGDRGYSAYEIWIMEGHHGTIQDFLDSLVGKSAYEIWIDLGHQGTEQDFIDSLKGERGYSAYEIWLQEGHTGTEEDFIRYLTTTTWSEF